MYPCIVFNVCMAISYFCHNAKQGGDPEVSIIMTLIFENTLEDG